MPALYTSLSVMAEIREANQLGTLQPTTLVSCDADLEPVFDPTDPVALDRYGMTPPGLAADDWRLRTRDEAVAPTQGFADRLVAEGHVAMRVPTFARGARAANLNLVLWTWGSDPPARLVLIDDELRLG